MIQIKLMLCADGVVIDRLNNNVSVFNIFEEITPAGLPLAIPRFVVLAILERDTGDPAKLDCSIKVTLKDQSIIDQTVPVDFQDKLRNHSVFTMVGMPIPDSGTLQTSIWYGEQKLGQYDVKVNPPPKPHVESHSA